MAGISEHIQGILDTLPTKPGCYIMKNAGGEIIYVGKAISLRNRVRSYFQQQARPGSSRRASWSAILPISNGSWSARSSKRSSWK